MRAFFAAVFVVLYWLAFSALFGCASQPQVWPYGVEPPPPSYLTRTPAVPVITHQIAEPNPTCQALFPSINFIFDGCTVLLSFRCDVYEPIPSEWFTPEHVAAIETHEIQGHCNGLVHHYAHGWFKPDGTEVTK